MANILPTVTINACVIHQLSKEEKLCCIICKGSLFHTTSKTYKMLGPTLICVFMMTLLMNHPIHFE